jgi:hypothetical protein
MFKNDFLYFCCITNRHNITAYIIYIMNTKLTSKQNKEISETEDIGINIKNLEISSFIKSMSSKINLPNNYNFKKVRIDYLENKHK